MKSTGAKNVVLYEYSDSIKWKIFNRTVNLKKKLAILDLGCGYGPWSVKLAKQGHNVVGIDISTESIKNARNLAKKEGVKIKFDDVPAEKIKFKNNTFDLVISITTLQHLMKDSDWNAAVKKIYHCLKPGGLFFLIESAPLFPKEQKLKFKAERTYEKQRKNIEKQGFNLIKASGTMFIGYKFFYAAELFLPKFIRNQIQSIGLFFAKIVDLFLSRFGFLTTLSDHKMMYFRK